MASIQLDGANWHIAFTFAGKRFKRSLRTTSKEEATAALYRVRQNIQLVLAGRLRMDDQTDVPTFLMSDGVLNDRPTLATSIPLGELFPLFLESVPANSLEAETLRVTGVHMRHVVRILGEKTQLHTIQAKHLQSYVTARSKEPGRNGNVSSTTIKKELGSFSVIWNFAMQQGIVGHPFPRQRLHYPRTAEIPRFQTWAQIERQIEGESLDKDQADRLWECLYLSTEELDELLSYIRHHSSYPFLHPMSAMAAFTGARRSELARARRSDIDFQASTISIRENKRKKGLATLRLVPLSTQLESVFSRWLSEQPNGPFLFPSDHRVSRRRKNAAQGHVTPDEASDKLERTLENSKWKVVRGFHSFRHSFISILASRGVDQRMIDEWVGHSTDAQRRRYRHLFPDSQRIAIDKAFE